VVPAPTNSELNHMIDENIHSEKARNIMRRKLVDGVSYYDLADETGMSIRGLKYLVKRNKELL